MRPVSALSLALVPALVLGLAGAAQADSRLSDAEFIQASQCMGMTYDHKKIEALDALVRREKKDRDGAIRLQARQQQQRAQGALLHASGLKRRALEERYAAECDPLLDRPLVQAEAAPAAAPSPEAAVEPSRTRKLAAGMKGAVARVFGRGD